MGNARVRDWRSEPQKWGLVTARNDKIGRYVVPVPDQLTLAFSIVGYLCVVLSALAAISARSRGKGNYDKQARGRKIFQRGTRGRLDEDGTVFNRNRSAALIGSVLGGTLTVLAHTDTVLGLVNGSGIGVVVVLVLAVAAPIPGAMFVLWLMKVIPSRKGRHLP